MGIIFYSLEFLIFNDITLINYNDIKKMLNSIMDRPKRIRIKKL